MDALLQLGDSHWYGRGAERDWARAAQLYQTASKFRNAQALFNLGFMHEFGAGLPQVWAPFRACSETNALNSPINEEPRGIHFAGGILVVPLHPALI